MTAIPSLRGRAVEIAAQARIQDRPAVSLAKGSRIRIGGRCVLCSDSEFNALGMNHPRVMRTLSSPHPTANCGGKVFPPYSVLAGPCNGECG